MTGTIGAHAVPEGAKHDHPASASTTTTPTALVEQAKGVLIFRYAIGAETAYELITRWAAEAETTVDAVAHAVVHEICQGDRSRPSDPTLVRWLEDRLRHEFPAVDPADAGPDD